MSHRQLGWVVVVLGLCGIGMAFADRSRAQIRSPGSPVARAARTVAARDAGLVLGLLILTPVFVHELNAAPNRAIPPVASSVVEAPIPFDLKAQLAAGLLAANAKAAPSRLPHLGSASARVEAQASAPTRAQLTILKARVASIIGRAATRSFRRPLFYCALLALLAIPLLALGHGRLSRARLTAREPVPGA